MSDVLTDIRDWLPEQIVEVTSAVWHCQHCHSDGPAADAIPHRPECPVALLTRAREELERDYLGEVMNDARMAVINRELNRTRWPLDARESVCELLGWIGTLQGELERLEAIAERRWIPVSEQLPEPNDSVPVESAFKRRRWTPVDEPVLVRCHIDGHDPWVEIRHVSDLPSYATHWKLIFPLPEEEA